MSLSEYDGVVTCDKCRMPTYNCACAPKANVAAGMTQLDWSEAFYYALKTIPLGNRLDLQVNRYNTDDEQVLQLYREGRTYDIRTPLNLSATHPSGAAPQPPASLTDLERRAQPILTNCCGLLDQIKSEWTSNWMDAGQSENCWSEWDQSVRDAASLWLKDSYERASLAAPAKDKKDA